MIDSHLIFNTFLLLVLFLLAVSCITGFTTAFFYYGKYLAKDEILNKRGSLFFFRFFLKKFFKQNEIEFLHFSLSFTRHVFYIVYAILVIILLNILFVIQIYHLIWIGIFVILSFIVIDILMRSLAKIFPKKILKLTSFFTSIFLYILSPITAFSYKLMKFFVSKKEKKKNNSKHNLFIQEKIMEVMKDVGISSNLNSQDKKIIASFITFREKVAREIMTPRIDVEVLDINSTIKEAVDLCFTENFSRIPVYTETQENIIGILLFKDIFKLFIQNDESVLSKTIKSIVKPAIYAPENKKISLLFQEFRSKQNHLAIIVNEYGTMEGIVSIEDILEELVGEIEDEYDIDEGRQFWKLPDKSIVIDAKMSIIDIESQINIHIPHSVEYETLGGYIFHEAGTIPKKGWKLHHENFDLEVLISNERCIEKVKIIPNMTDNN